MRKKIFTVIMLLLVSLTYNAMAININDSPTWKPDMDNPQDFHNPNFPIRHFKDVNCPFDGFQGQVQISKQERETGGFKYLIPNLGLDNNGPVFFDTPEAAVEEANKLCNAQLAIYKRMGGR